MGSGKTVQELKPFTECGRIGQVSQSHRGRRASEWPGCFGIRDTGGLALYSPDRAELLVELGNWDRWTSVRFEANPDRIVAKSDAGTYSWPFFTLRRLQTLPPSSCRSMDESGSSFRPRRLAALGSRGAGCREDANAASQMSQ